MANWPRGILSAEPETASIKIIEYGILLILFAVFVFRGLVPGWRSLNTDFPNYYLASRLYRQGYPLRRVYDWVWFQRQTDHANVDQPLVSFIPNPPSCILPFLPLASFSPLVAKRWWLVINLLLLGGIILLLNSIVQLGLRRVGLIAFLAVIALRANFLYGQEHLAVAFLLAFAAFLYFRGMTAGAGAVLALGTALKIYPGVFLFYFLRKRQWRAITGFSLSSLGLGLLSVALFGYETLRSYVIEILPRSLAGEVNDPYNTQWNSFTALLRRLFIAEPVLNPHPFVHLPVAYAVLQPLCQALLFVPTLWLISASREAPEKEKLEWGTYVALILILSPNPASYHFAALITAGVLGMNYTLERGREPLTRVGNENTVPTRAVTFATRAQAYLLLAFYALTCLPGLPAWLRRLPFFQALQTWHRLGALTALWLLLLWILARSGAGVPRFRIHSREAAAFGFLMFALVAAGIASNLRHQNGLFANYGNRLPTGEDTIVAAEPAIAGEQVLFTAMTLSGYATASLDHGSLTSLAIASDAFHPTISESGLCFVEVASTSSRVVRYPLQESAIKSCPHPCSPPFPTGGAGTEADQVAVEAEDAEQPVVSRDSKWLAFIRENRGRGRLWVKALAPNASSSNGSAGEWAASDARDDVLEASFFPDDRIVFAAQTASSPALFSTDPNTRRTSPFPVSSLPIRFPAVSPDGQWLAYSQREHGDWQLWLMRFSTREKRKLAGGDCNSTAPAWFGDSKTLVYATDCGRGLGMTALCRVQGVR